MRFVVFGEGMIEGRADGATAHGGDAVNTAVYLARRGARVELMTALGMDPGSESLREAWAAEGLGLGHVLRHPTRMAGRYDIVLDASGERRFTYDRSGSAARAFFDLPGAEAALADAASADVLYLTGVTLSIYGEAERSRIARLAEAVKAGGGQVAFDPNYRPAGWDSPAQALAAVERIAPHLTLALPSLDDHRALVEEAAPDAALAWWRGLGIPEVVLKRGAEGALVSSDGARVAIPAASPARLVDTTAAGDAFNAAYLDARFRRGEAPAQAGRAGAALAAEVIAWPGAISPRH